MVQCVSPYFVTSKLSKIRHASVTTPTPEAYARSVVAAIGRGGASIVPYWPHAAQDWAVQHTPDWLLARQLVGMHLGLRSRFLKKKAAEASASSEGAGATAAGAADAPTSGPGSLKKRR